MSYRPICDVWILARPKVKYYGAYPNGFLERALPLIGASDQDRVLHLCGGRAKDYPNKRLVAFARTADSDQRLRPDFVCDLSNRSDALEALGPQGPWPFILVDPPYTEADHLEYQDRGAPHTRMPSANALLRLALELVVPGHRVGFLHYVWPQPPKTARSIACVGVIVGFNNRMRCFSVFERIAEPTEPKQHDG